MNRNLYSKELKRNRKTLVIWSFIVIALTALVMSVFPYMKNMGDDMAIMMSKLPEGMTKSMGINLDTFNNILGMYNTYYGIYIIVLLSIYASSTGANILSKEEKNKTAEFLLTKPISRQTIFNTKLLVLFTLALFAFFVQTIIAFTFVMAYGGEEVQWSVFITMHTHGLMLILFFTSLGLVLSMLLKPKTNFMGICVGLVFGSYFLNAVAKASDDIYWIGHFSPFHYLDFSVSDPDYSIDFVTVAVMLFISVLLVFVSYKFYKKKDISA
jgi:ABC-2 type transport system permease protein